MALDADAENLTLDWLTGNGTTPPVLPLRVRLMTAIGDDENPGTQVAGGGYTPQEVVFGPAQSGQTSNVSVVRFDNMPDVPGTTDGSGNVDTGGVRAFEIWDSGGTPRRWWYAPLTTPRIYQAGDAAEFPAGQLVLAME